jgi:hypothetical protein
MPSDSELVAMVYYATFDHRLQAPPRQGQRTEPLFACRTQLFEAASMVLGSRRLWAVAQPAEQSKQASPRASELVGTQALIDERSLQASPR